MNPRDKKPTPDEAASRTNSRFISYCERATEIRNKSAMRMGYPVMGPIHGFFTPSGWQRVRDSVDAPRLVDNSAFGIMPNSIADTLMINIGGQLQVAQYPGQAAPVRSGAWRAEIDIIHMLARHFNIPKESLRGYVTTGGTEGNLACLWWSRECLLAKVSEKYPTRKISPRPILFASDQCHYSIPKIANILAIEFETVPSDGMGRILIESLVEKVKQRMLTDPGCPVMVCCTIGSTQLGAIDNVPEVKKVLETLASSHHGLYTIHMDAALLGVTLPITQPFGPIESIFDFSDTIAMSGHKFFGTTAVCGVALAKHVLLERVYKDKDVVVRYVGGIQDTTVTGTRSGFNVLELHNAMCSLDLDTDAAKLKLIIKQCLDNLQYLINKLSEMMPRDKIIYNPKQFVVVFPRPSGELGLELENKYGLMPVGNSHFGVCVLASVDISIIDRFLNDYRLSTESSNSGTVQSTRFKAKL